MFFSFVFEQYNKAVELPPVELLVPVLVSTLTPVSRLTVAVLVFSNLAQSTDSDVTDSSSYQTVTPSFNDHSSIGKFGIIVVFILLTESSTDEINEHVRFNSS